METEKTIEDLPEFVAPGPGTWMMDAGHFARPIFGVIEEIVTPAFDQGMRRCMQEYGMLLETFDVRVVNGFPYLQPRPVGAPPGGGKAPPPWLFRLIFAVLTRVHPEIRRRLARQRGLFARRPWRDAVRDWDERLKGETIARHAEVDAVDVASLDDGALAAHLGRLKDHAIAMLAQDHGLNLAFMLPMGDFLHRAHDATGASVAELMHLLRGASGISAGDSDERRAVLAALRSDPEARALLESDAAPREVYDRLSAWPGEVGRAMRQFRVIWGNAICHGITVLAPTVAEEPSAFLGALRASLGHGGRRTVQPVDPAALRARVSGDARADFDVILEDARLTYRLRDERHLYGALPCLGLARRALLEVGRRLHARSVVADPRHALVARSDEIERLLAKGDAAGIDTLAETLAERFRLSEVLDGNAVPERLGPEPPAPPPAEWLPHEDARRAMRALDAYLRGMQESGETLESRTAIEGLAVSGGVHEGTARLCASAADLDRVRPGDVLVASVTTPAINVVLPMLGAIVTDRGGALSHAAIVCREFGIPGVVGTRTATRAIREGCRVRVDGDRGVVAVVAG